MTTFPIHILTAHDSRSFTSHGENQLVNFNYRSSEAGNVGYMADTRDFTQALDKITVPNSKIRLDESLMRFAVTSKDSSFPKIFSCTARRTLDNSLYCHGVTVQS